MRTWRKAIGVRRRMVVVVVGQGKRQVHRVVEWKPKAFLIILFISLLLFIIIVIVDIELVFFLLLLTFSSLGKEARG